MEDIKRNLNTAFELMRKIRVSEDDVERMARAKLALQEAWQACSVLQQEQQKEAGDGQTD